MCLCIDVIWRGSWDSVDGTSYVVVEMKKSENLDAINKSLNSYCTQLCIFSNFSFQFESFHSFLSNFQRNLNKTSLSQEEPS